VGNVQPIGNHTAGRVDDVQRGCILLGRAGQNHAVVIGVVDGRPIDGDVLRSGCSEADCALYVLNYVAAASRGLRIRLCVAGRKAGLRVGCAALCLTLVMSGRVVAGGIQTCIQRLG
jgi:hypothetical protein